MVECFPIAVDARLLAWTSIQSDIGEIESRCTQISWLWEVSHNIFWCWTDLIYFTIPSETAKCLMIDWSLEFGRVMVNNFSTIFSFDWLQWENIAVILNESAECPLAVYETSFEKAFINDTVAYYTARASKVSCELLHFFIVCVHSLKKQQFQ